MSAALIVFAKVPAAGEVKTRLVPSIDEREAAALYEAFLLDSLDAYVTLTADVRLYLAPTDAQFDTSSIPTAVDVLPQTGNGLGDRMARAFLETFAAGFERAAIVGTDHPTLPASFIQHALDVLSSPKSIAIGPAEDGGYYLLAMREFFPQLFREMSYSHASVFDQTLVRCASADREITVLPMWYDVDTAADLRRLCIEAAKNNDIGPRTKGQLAILMRRHKWLSV